MSAADPFDYADDDADDEAAFWRDQRPVCRVAVNQPCIRVAGNPTQPVQPPEPIRKYPAHTPRVLAARRKLATA